MEIYPPKASHPAFYELPFWGRTLGSLEEKGTVSHHEPSFVRGGQPRALESTHVKGQHRETGRDRQTERDRVTQREEERERFKAKEKQREETRGQEGEE